MLRLHISSALLLKTGDYKNSSINNQVCWLIYVSTNRIPRVMIQSLLLTRLFPGNIGSLLCRHNGRDGVSNHQPRDCLFNRSVRCRSQKTPKLRVTGRCEGNSRVTGEFSAQIASNAESVSIWWRHVISAFCPWYWTDTGGKNPPLNINLPILQNQQHGCYWPRSRFVSIDQLWSQRG